MQQFRDGIIDWIFLRKVLNIDSFDHLPQLEGGIKHHKSRVVKTLLCCRFFCYGSNSLDPQGDRNPNSCSTKSLLKYEGKMNNQTHLGWTWQQWKKGNRRLWSLQEIVTSWLKLVTHSNEFSHLIKVAKTKGWKSAVSVVSWVCGWGAVCVKVKNCKYRWGELTGPRPQRGGRETAGWNGRSSAQVSQNNLQATQDRQITHLKTPGPHPHPTVITFPPQELRPKDPERFMTEAPTNKEKKTDLRPLVYTVVWNESAHPGTTVTHLLLRIFSSTTPTLVPKKQF